MTRVAVPGRMLLWAIERSDTSIERLRGRFARLDDWIAGERRPTLKQLEAFSNATHTPIGYLFLPEPPVETVPIPDFRTMAGRPIPRPSPNLLDTVYLCQQRQEWYRDYARAVGSGPLRFVGSASINDPVVPTAAEIRKALGFDLGQRRQMKSWTEALRHFVEEADELGIMVMVSGVVASNNTRKLDPEEFRGFALADKIAPLVFINGADTKSGQMFTLAHELAHVWLDQTALSDATARNTPKHAVERWCNLVAAELLVPLEAISIAEPTAEPLRATLDHLARQFKVSTLVILRRLHDARRLNKSEYWQAYDAELGHLRKIAASRAAGGDYYLTTSARVSPRFARALITATWEGRTTFTEAFHMLGCRKTETLRELGLRVGAGV